MQRPGLFGRLRAAVVGMVHVGALPGKRRVGGTAGGTRTRTRSGSGSPASALSPAAVPLEGLTSLHCNPHEALEVWALPVLEVKKAGNSSVEEPGLRKQGLGFGDLLF